MIKKDLISLSLAVAFFFIVVPVVFSAPQNTSPKRNFAGVTNLQDSYPQTSTTNTSVKGIRPIKGGYEASEPLPVVSTDDLSQNPPVTNKFEEEWK